LEKRANRSFIVKAKRVALPKEVAVVHAYCPRSAILCAADQNVAGIWRKGSVYADGLMACNILSTGTGGCKEDYGQQRTEAHDVPFLIALRRAGVMLPDGENSV
jgi:hypothetical protein